jgi:hypothetical protein
MLYRALEMARAQAPLPAEFFSWGESRALTWLETGAGAGAAQLIGALRVWRQYPRVLAVEHAQPDPRLTALYDDWSLRRQVADSMAQSLGLDPVDLCLYAGEDRGAKTVRLPWVGPGSQAASELLAGSAPSQRVAVYAVKSKTRRLTGDRVRAALEDALTGVPGRASAHAFF